MLKLLIGLFLVFMAVTALSFAAWVCTDMPDIPAVPDGIQATAVPTPQATPSLIIPDTGGEPLPEPEAPQLTASAALALSSTWTQTGKPVTAAITVHNCGENAVLIQTLVVEVKPGLFQPQTDQQFPAAQDIWLEPGSEYTYTAALSFTHSGEFYAEAVVQVNGNWQPLAGGTRVWFGIYAPGIEFSRASDGIAKSS